jgi:hypothetical protein
MTPICKNCDRLLEENFAFCPACGQRTDTQRLRMREVLADFWAHFTDIDRGFFTLLRDLVVRPGSIAQEYIAGRRKKHFGPLSFYLIVGTILILSMNMTEWIHARTQIPAGSATSINSSPDGVSSLRRSTAPDTIIAAPAAGVQPTRRDSMYLKGATSKEEVAARIARVQGRRQAANNFWKQYSDLVSIGAAPLLCLFFWFVYRPAGLNYTELLVASLYMMGFTNLVFALIASPVTTMLSSATSGRSSFIITGVFKAFEIAYFTYFFSQFTQGLVRRPLLRASLASIFVSVFWTGVTFVLMMVYMMTGFGMD